MKCQFCGKSFSIQERAVRRGRGKFCSASCHGRSKIAHVNRTRKKTTHNAGWFTTETALGANNPRWKPPAIKVCKNCHQSFEIKEWILRQPSNRGDFCSIECRGEYRTKYQSGDNSPFWVGGAQTKRGRGWQEIRRIIISNQNGNCADCGAHKGKSLPIHHIKPFRDFQNPEEANQLDNLIGLCQSCHMKREHRKA